MKKHAYVLVFCSWIMHGIAWFLPTVTSVWGGAISPGISGFEAFCIAASEALHQGGGFDSWYGEMLSDISVIGTVLFVLGSPWLLMHRCGRFRRAFAWVALAVFVANSHWFTFARKESFALGAGYFLWWFSFLLLAFGLFELGGKQIVVVEGTQLTAAKP